MREGYQDKRGRQERDSLTAKPGEEIKRDLEEDYEDELDTFDDENIVQENDKGGKENEEKTEDSEGNNKEEEEITEDEAMDKLNE